MASGDDKKIEKRKSKRILLQVNAIYMEENKRGWQDCSIVDVSREGMGVILYLREPIQAGAKLSFAIKIASNIFKETGITIWSKKLCRDTLFNGALGIKLETANETSKSAFFKYIHSNYSKSDKQWEEEKYFL